MLELDGAMYDWHPAGKSLSFVRQENGAMNLWLHSLDGNASRKLTSFSEGVIPAYAWTADGSAAAVVHAVDAIDVVLIR